MEHLKIYKAARTLEDKIFELARDFPAEYHYAIGNESRRGAAATSHHIMAAERLFSYRLKLDELAAVRREAGQCQTNVSEMLRLKLITPEQHMELANGYIDIIEQSWRYTKQLKSSLATRAAAKEVK